MLRTIGEVEQEYKTEDIQKTDTVLDIGACIGAFSLKVHKQVKHVYACEPIMTKRLRENVDLNNAKNITVLDCALGKGMMNIKWGEKERYLKGKTLTEILSICGHIDFLKIDCEGGEWHISPQELLGIRRIEVEVHNFDGRHDFNSFLEMLSDAGFKYEYTITTKELMLVHAVARNVPLHDLEENDGM